METVLPWGVLISPGYFLREMRPPAYYIPAKVAADHASPSSSFLAASFASATVRGSPVEQPGVRPEDGFAFVGEIYFCFNGKK
jgi:hypothetical protein